MRSRISCFNRKLCGYYLRRFWPLSVIVLAVTLIYPGTRLLDLRYYGDLSQAAMRYAAMDVIYASAELMMILLAGAAILAAALVFRHLHSLRELQFTQALPLRRRENYGAAWMAGFLLLALPMALGAGILALGLALAGVGGAAIALGKLLLAGLAGELLLYGLAVIACVLAGQTLGAVLIYAGFHCAAALLIQGASFVGSLFLPGIRVGASIGSLKNILTPLYLLILSTAVRHGAVPVETNGYYFFGVTGDGSTMYVSQGFARPGTLAILAAVGLLVSLIGLWAYQIRRSENAGDMIAFAPIRTVCKVFGALMVCAAGSLVLLNTGLYLDGTPFPVAAAVVLLTAALGWIAAEMIVRKSLRVIDRRFLRDGGILLAALLVIMLAARIDLGGRVKYVPAPDRVETATVQYNGNSTVTLRPEDAAALHETILDHRDLLANGMSGYSQDLILRYELKNGRVLSRYYSVRTDYVFSENPPENPIFAAMNELFSRPEYAVEALFGADYGAISQDTVTYAAFIRWEDGEELDLSPAEAMEFYDAICQDARAGRVAFREDGAGIDAIGGLELSWALKPYDTSFGTYSRYLDDVDYGYAYVYITEDMPAATAFLAAHLPGAIS